MEVKIKRYTSGKRDGSVRKVEVKLDSYDTWCIPWTLSQVLEPMLKQLKEVKHGYGAVDKEDVPEQFHNTYDEHGYSEEAYNWLLDELIWTFGQVKTDNEEEPRFIEEADWDGVGDFSEHFRSLKVDEGKKQEYHEYHERIKNGWMLLGKYGQTLWD